MGSAVVSSKSKKNSGEDMRKRKNPKSRKRRRVSDSSSSDSSDPDDVSRRRRNSRRKSERRRGRERKRPVNRKSRKARHRSANSASRDSSSSCSTCRSWSSDSPNGSRSPVRRRDNRKGNVKKEMKRGRPPDRVDRTLRIRNRSISCSTCSGSSIPSHSHGYRETRSKEKDGLKQIGSSSVIQSQRKIEEVYGSSVKKLDNEIMPNCGGSKLPRANAGHDVHKVEGEDDGFYDQGIKMDRWMSEGNAENDSYFDEFEEHRTRTSYHFMELELYPKLSSRIKSEIVAAHKHDLESDDLELMLRQKALENLKKLRGGLTPNNGNTADNKNELAGNESYEKPSETAIIINPLSEPHSIVSEERKFQLEVPSLDSKVKNPIIKLPSLEVNDPTSDKKTVFCRLNGMEVSQENISGNSCPNGKEEICDTTIKTVEECQSGSQFEQKTFSRMHDGEMVQVSYKVYIPKKTPALARRKLQR